jgi:hypothetical protein
MSAPVRIALESFDHYPPPWTLHGSVDLDVGDDVRKANHVALTAPGLTRRFRRHHPWSRRAEYDAMVRALGYVWDCPVDHTANVTGYCCPSCGRGRSAAGG